MKTDTELLAEANALDECYASAALGDAEAYEHDARELARAARAAVLAWSDAGGYDGHFDGCHIVALEAALEHFEPWLEMDEKPEGRP